MMEHKKTIPLLILILIVCVPALIIGLFFFFKLNLFLQTPAKITRRKIITISTPANWRLYHQTDDYDLDFGYYQGFRNLACRINFITAVTDRPLTFEQFLSTTLEGKMFLANKNQTKIAGQDALEASYSFPANGIKEPTQSQRVLFKWKGIFVDATLSYYQKLDSKTISLCQKGFEEILLSADLK